MRQWGTHPAAVVKLVDRGVDGGLIDADAANCLEDLAVPKEGGKNTIWCTWITTGIRGCRRAYGLVNIMSDAPRVQRVVRELKQYFVGRTPQVRGSSRLTMRS
jgi:hypothetical protein